MKVPAIKVEGNLLLSGVCDPEGQMVFDRFGKSLNCCLVYEEP